MVTKQQQERITRKCTTMLIQAVDKLPELLSECEPEPAAAIIADLIKAGITLTAPEEEEDFFDIPDDDDDDEGE